MCTKKIKVYLAKINPHPLFVKVRQHMCTVPCISATWLTLFALHVFLDYNAIGLHIISLHVTPIARSQWGSYFCGHVFSRRALIHLLTNEPNISTFQIEPVEAWRQHLDMLSPTRWAKSFLIEDLTLFVIHDCDEGKKIKICLQDVFPLESCILKLMQKPAQACSHT